MGITNRRISLGLGISFTLTAATLVSAGLWAAGAASQSAPEKAVQATAGQAIYLNNCASCHGANLEGQSNWRTRKPDGRLPAPPHDKTGHTWHHPDDVLFGITKNGLSGYAPVGYESDMPAFADVLTDEEIRAVISYIKSRWPERILSRREGNNGGKK